MNLDQLLAAIKESDLHEHISDFWDIAQRECPPEAYATRYLTLDAIQQAWSDGQFFTQDAPDELIEMAQRIRSTPELLALAAYSHWRQFEGPPEQPPKRQWPELRNCLGCEAELFYLIVALGFIPSVQAYHQSLNLPSAITQGTGLQVARYCDNYRRGRGRLGIYIRQFGWLGNYMPPNLYFRIGRFEYWKRTFKQPVCVFRRRSDGATLALSQGDLVFTPAGDRCLTGAPPRPGSWISSYTESETAFTGNPLSPSGRACREPVQLPRDAWTCVLKPGDPVLDMHIPAGGGMSPEVATASLQEAYSFFNTFFPEPRVQAVASASWMFSNQLEACLPPTANLVQLLRKLYLLPHASSPNAGLWFVFLQDGGFNPDTAPRDTSLQRAILDTLAQTQEPWHVNGMFILCDDLDSPNSETYRHNWPPQGLGL